MAPQKRKISAASARSHTRKHKQSKLPSLPPGILTKLLLVLSVGLVAWAYQAIQPPPPSICGSPNGPPITTSRIKLKDGRHLSYIEIGTPKEKAKYKIISIHAFDNCKYDVLPISPELFDELGLYILSFDRAGYGESDPNPNDSVKSTALDVEELADKLGLGSKFFIIGTSIGGAYSWGCLKYIPHRIAGAALIAPASNYWWPGFPANVSKEAFAQQLVQDQWGFRVAHHAPWLTYWWNTQKWFPIMSPITQDPKYLYAHDLEILGKAPNRDSYVAQIRQQGEFVCLHKDMNTVFGNWDFDPLNLSNPFAESEGSLHIWHGDADSLVPVALSRYISQKLPWVQYHEIPGGGHFLQFVDGLGDKLVKLLVKGH